MSCQGRQSSARASNETPRRIIIKVNGILQRGVKEVEKCKEGIQIVYVILVALLSIVLKPPACRYAEIAC